ncbi:enoyl-CoA hydratase-related protein, partial [Variovorax sp. 2RAF20]
LIRGIRDCGKPVIAAVEGGAAGAGLSMALACDMLVSARDAFYTVAYVKVGLTPDGGATAFLAEFVSRQVLTEMCLTGDRMTA